MSSQSGSTPATMAGLKIAFLTGADTAATRDTIDCVCRVPGMQAVALLLDTGRPSLYRRWKNLRRNIAREGLGYVGRRLLGAIRRSLETMASAVAPDSEVRELLAAAFPDRPQSLDDLAARLRIPLFRAGNLNGPEAAAILRESGAELGVVLGTRILKRSIFEAPRLGCINLHKGKVPDYRGMPPGFWEIYDRAESAGVTVHFVDDGLDTGDVIGESEIPIHARETPESLKAKLDAEGARLLVESLSALMRNTAVRRRQPASGRKPRTKPTRAEWEALYRRVPHLPRPPGDARQILKTVWYLALWMSGVHFLLRRRKRRPGGRAAILLYHRVNDISADPLTTGTRRFAEHLAVLGRYYHVVSTAWLVDRVRRGEYIPPRSVAIHFDDCYRDVATQAAPMLLAARMPAAMFIASGFIDTDRVFEHDAAKYPHRFENLQAGDIARLLASGIEVGAHTVNHANLGAVPLEQAHFEVNESKRQLEELAGMEVPYFSFPYGTRRHFQAAVGEMVVQAGYRALFSAYGGFVSARSDPFDIPRMGVSSEHRPLDVLMELEGISLRDLGAQLRRWFRRGRTGAAHLPPIPVEDTTSSTRP